MELEFEIQRSERRSFFCSNQLWQQMQKKTGNNTSISTYIKQAIKEKMSNEEKKRGFNNIK